MNYNLNQVIDREGTGSNKWELYRGGSHAGPIVPIDPKLERDGPIPMWVADMDFASPQPVLDALSKRINHGIFGYTSASEGYYSSIVSWFENRHDWKISKEWITTTPGVVPALHFAVKTWCHKGDKVLIQKPVYYPFFRAITNGGCEIVSSNLIEEGGFYSMDFEDLEAKASDPKVKISILCSPHNPVGRVWTSEELRQYGDICNRNGVIVIADEIHSDLMMPGNFFQPYASLGDKFANNVMVCTAPSKTFNLAGMHLSNMVIPNSELKKEYDSYMFEIGVAGGLNPLALVAIEAAYRRGEDWLSQVLEYIHKNYLFLVKYVAENIPQLSISDLQGTYLAWIDFRALGLDQVSLEKLTQLDAKVLFDEGHVFGEEGLGFERINIACPRSILVLALERLKVQIKLL